MLNKRILGIFLMIAGIAIAAFGLLYQMKEHASLTELNQTANTTISGTPIPLSSRLLINNIFRYKDPADVTVSGKNKEGEYVLLATGDVIPARSVNSIMVRKKNFKYPFEKTASFLQIADLVFINLETPLFSGCKITDTGMKFCGSEKVVEGLKYANVQVASLANNHAGNFGNEGLVKTEELLLKNGIAVTGLGKPAIVAVKDKKFGFLGYNDIEKNENLSISLASNDKIATEVARLKKQVDFVIVTFHWGIEYTGSSSARQITLAHTAVDSGADLIIGNHPHTVGGVEIYKNKFITYAHGNFIFDQMWSQETREGVIGKYVFDKYGLTDVSYFPVIIENYSQPRFAKEKEAVKILERMKKSGL